MTLSRRIKTQKQQLEKELQKSQAFLKSAPEGALICQKTPHGVKWLQRQEPKDLGTSRKRIYISQKNKSLAEQLALKKYHKYKIQEINEELKALNAYLKYHKENLSKMTGKILNTVGLQELLQPVICPLSEELKHWMYASYKQNPLYPEQRNIKTLSGQKVRSKSESLIALKLTEFQIPFRYEAELYLEEQIYYPDFTLRHPDTGNFFYWEHFGLMDNPAYAEKAFDKIGTYITHGIFPFANLLMTFESKENPLDIEQVEALIQYYFT